MNTNNNDNVVIVIVVIVVIVIVVIVIAQGCFRKKKHVHSNQPSMPSTINQ